jgi:hypothetical protein
VVYAGRITGGHATSQAGTGWIPDDINERARFSGRRLHAAAARTPLPQSATCKIVRQSDLKLNEEGGLEGTVTVTYTGLEALQQRLNERLSDETRKKEYLEEELKS